mgnify:FL=1|tara:strand:- start:970 stop:1353 length:384 start_codon:yes stop_codon:yes gene_type:complete
MNILLWIAQGLLGALFIMVGLMKTFQPIEEIAKSLPWVAEYSSSLVRFIGISELLGGIGLLLPSILKVQPKLTVWAAYGLTLVMILAAIFHISRGEYSGVIANLIIGLVAAFIAWGRSKKVIILPKS